MDTTDALFHADNSPDLAVTRAEVLARVDTILPILGRLAEQAEADRDLSPESIDALIESGALRLFVQRRFVSYEAG